MCTASGTVHHATAHHAANAGVQCKKANTRPRTRMPGITLFIDYFFTLLESVGDTGRREPWTSRARSLSHDLSLCYLFSLFSLFRPTEGIQFLWQHLSMAARVFVWVSKRGLTR